MVPPKYDECLQVAESHGTGTGVREETDEAREREREREIGVGGVFCSWQPPALRGPDPRSVFNYLQGR